MYVIATTLVFINMSFTKLQEHPVQKSFRTQAECTEWIDNYAARQRAAGLHSSGWKPLPDGRNDVCAPK